MIATEFNPTHYNAFSQESRVAARLARVLEPTTRSLPAGVEERLRVAREQALAKARPESHGLLAGMPAGAAGLRWVASGWWNRMAVVLPIIGLAVGLVAIQQHHRQAQIATAVEIDAALLVDAAPLAAYRDAGFVEYLKTPD